MLMKNIKRLALTGSALLGAAIGSALASGTLEGAIGVWAG